MTETIEKTLYKGEHTIVFYPNSHKYKIKDEKTFLISVTGATGMLDKSRPLIIWATRLCRDFLKERLEQGLVVREEDVDKAVNLHNERRDEAADKGTQAHEWVERYIKGEVKATELPEDEEISSACIAFLKYVADHDVEFIESERFVYSPTYKYVGTLDAVAKIDGKLYVVDFKTSKGFYSDQRYQVAGYQQAYVEETKAKIEGRVIIKLGKLNADFNVALLPKEDYEADLSAFLGLLAVKQREKELYQWSKFINS